MVSAAFTISTHLCRWNKVKSGSEIRKSNHKVATRDHLLTEGNHKNEAIVCMRYHPNFFTLLRTIYCVNENGISYNWHFNCSIITSTIPPLKPETIEMSGPKNESNQLSRSMAIIGVVVAGMVVIFIVLAIIAIIATRKSPKPIDPNEPVSTKHIRSTTIFHPWWLLVKIYNKAKNLNINSQFIKLINYNLSINFIFN